MATAEINEIDIRTYQELDQQGVTAAEISDTTWGIYSFLVKNSSGQLVEAVAGVDNRFYGVALSNYDSTDTYQSAAEYRNLLLRGKAKGKMAASEALARASQAYLVKGSGSGNAIVQADVGKYLYATGGYTLEVAPADSTAPLAGRILSVTTVGTSADGECIFEFDAHLAPPVTVAGLKLYAVQEIDMADTTVTLVRTADGVNTELVGDNLFVDPNSSGTSEVLKLPPEADCEKIRLVIWNTGDEDIDVQTDAGASIEVVAAGQSGTFGCNGTTWYAGTTMMPSIDVETYTSGTAGVLLRDAVANAWEFKESTNSYMKFVTTNSAERIVISQSTNIIDAVDLIFGTGEDAVIRFSAAGTADALVIGLDDTSQHLHITDKAAVATAWTLAASTHPTVLIHSNTTPATDYLLIGNHDGTSATIDVVGGTTLNLDIAGTTAWTLDAGGTLLLDNIDAAFGTGSDAAIRFSDAGTADALVIALDNTSQHLHITDLGAVATAWTLAASTHPTVLIHSNTTPATDYLLIGNHDGTTATIDVVGGTTLNLDIAGTTAATVDAGGITLADGVDMTFGTGNDAAIRFSAAGTADALVIAVDDTSQHLHITDLAAVATAWTLAAATHPTVMIHSNTTPATDYLLIGEHDGTTATIDVVGGTTLNIDIAGATGCVITADQIDVTTVTAAALVLESSGPMTINLNDVNALQLDNAAIATFAAANDTAGNAVYIETQDGGPDASVAGGRAGGLYNLKTGDGSAGGAAQVGGAGGALSLITGAGGTPASGSANGGASGDIVIQTGAAGAAGAGGGTGGTSGAITLEVGAAGGAGGGTAGVQGCILMHGRVGYEISITTYTVTATITVAALRGGMITANEGTTNPATYTTPTGTEISAEFPDMAVGDGFFFHVVNISTDAGEDVTMAGGVDVTLVGSGFVASNNATTDKSAGTFFFRKTGATAWSMYRVG
jgi:hypothetical protein